MAVRVHGSRLRFCLLALTLSLLFILGISYARPQSWGINNCTVPTGRVVFPPTLRADTGQGVILTSFFTTQTAMGCIAATTLQGTPTWSYCAGSRLMLTRPVPGGTILFLNNSSFTDYSVNEMDLTGNIIHSLTESDANSQLTARGQQAIIDFNHEAIRLPNGYTAVIAHNERLETNVQGPGTVDVVGDMVLVLNTEWQISWSWNAFNHLPVSRVAILGEKCKPCKQNSAGCCPITLAPVANDWLHGNSLAYDPTDGNLIMSLRNQDWIVKIAYQDGAGDGHVVWNLGEGGAVTMLNTPKIPSPWFSHQHDVELIGTGSPKLLLLYDNGNTRFAANNTATSRGQALAIDEAAKTVDIKTNVDFGYYSFAYGTAQLLSNGNYWWQSGIAGGLQNAYPTKSTEYYPNGVSGTGAFSIQFADTAYRSFRMTSLTGF